MCQATWRSNYIKVKTKGSNSVNKQWLKMLQRPKVIRISSLLETLLKGSSKAMKWLKDKKKLLTGSSATGTSVMLKRQISTSSKVKSIRSEQLWTIYDCPIIHGTVRFSFRKIKRRLQSCRESVYNQLIFNQTFRCLNQLSRWCPISLNCLPSWGRARTPKHTCHFLKYQKHSRKTLCKSKHSNHWL